MNFSVFMPKSLAKSTLYFGLASCMICYSLISFAQKTGKSTSFGIGLEAGISPNVITTQFVNLSVVGRFSLHAGPGYAFLAVAYMVSRAGLDFQIPVRLGYKFLFSKQFFISEELGYYSYNTSEEHAPYQTTAINGLSLATSIGMQFGIFDLGLRYDAIINQTDKSTIGIMLGWNF
jgi:hypothetical protein